MERGRNVLIGVVCALVVIAFLVGLGYLSAELVIALVEAFDPG